MNGGRVSGVYGAMRAFRGLRFVLLFSLVGLSEGCYSIAQWREIVEIGSVDRQDRITVERWHETGSLNDPQFGVVQTVGPLVLYPLDVVISFASSVDFAFDPNWRVRWGPLGAALAIVCPWVTVTPMPVFGYRSSRCLDARRYDGLVRAIRAGNGRSELAAILECDPAEIETVEIVPTDPPRHETRR